MTPDPDDLTIDGADLLAALRPGPLSHTKPTPPSVTDDSEPRVSSQIEVVESKEGGAWRPTLPSPVQAPVKLETGLERFGRIRLAGLAFALLVGVLLATTILVGLTPANDSLPVTNAELQGDS